MYSCEYLGADTRFEEAVEACDMRVLRKIELVAKVYKIRNEAIRKSLGACGMLGKIEAQHVSVWSCGENADNDLGSRNDKHADDQENHGINESTVILKIQSKREAGDKKRWGRIITSTQQVGGSKAISD